MRKFIFTFCLILPIIVLSQQTSEGILEQLGSKKWQINRLMQDNQDIPIRKNWYFLMDFIIRESGNHIVSYQAITDLDETNGWSPILIDTAKLTIQLLSEDLIYKIDQLDKGTELVTYRLPP